MRVARFFKAGVGGIAFGFAPDFSPFVQSNFPSTLYLLPNISRKKESKNRDPLETLFYRLERTNWPMKEDHSFPPFPPTRWGRPPFPFRGGGEGEGYICGTTSDVLFRPISFPLFLLLLVAPIS